MALRFLGLAIPESVQAQIKPRRVSIKDKVFKTIQNELQTSKKKLEDLTQKPLLAVSNQMQSKTLQLQKMRSFAMSQMQAISEVVALKANFLNKIQTELLLKRLKELGRYRLSVSIVDQVQVVKESKQEIADCIILSEKAKLLEPKPVRQEDWIISEKLEVPIHKMPRFYGLGELNTRKFMEETGFELILLENGSFWVIPRNSEGVAEAKDTINKLLTKEKDPVLEYNGIYTARIYELRDSGVMVKLYPTMEPTLLRNADLDYGIVHNRKARSLGLREGQEIEVKYLGRDPATGVMRLSRRDAIQRNV